jgi:hypothetical protein
MSSFDDDLRLARELAKNAVKINEDKIHADLAEYRTFRTTYPTATYDEEYRKAVSLFQRKVGKTFEQLVYRILDQVTKQPIERQRRLSGFKRKPIDGHHKTRDVDFYFSIANSTRERKDNTFNNEFALLSKRYQREQRKFRFICLVNEDGELKNLRGKLHNHGIELISVRNIDQISMLLHDLRDE